MSTKLLILCSFEITFHSDNGNPVGTLDLFLEGFSPCLLGRHVTRSFNKMHINYNLLQFPVCNGFEDHITMLYCQTRSFLSLDRFTNFPNRPGISSSNTVTLVGHTTSTTSSLPFSETVKRSLSEVTRIFGRVHD